MFDAIVLADLHWGAIELDRFKYELDRCLFDKINHMKKLDAIFIAGDLFDMKEYSSSETFREVLAFLNKLIACTDKLGCEIAVIKGTGNHDDLQLHTLETIYQSCNRIKFIHTVSDYTMNDVRILYVPEECVVDQELYYKEYFENHYDIMIGHGMIDKIWYAKNNKRSGMSSAPVFPVEQLCQVANYCYFGHVHEHKTYGKNKHFKYVGPVTVWEYDKQAHGYYIIHYSKETELMKEEYVENEHAQIMKSRAIVVDQNTTSLEPVMELVDTIITEEKYDRLKLIVTLDERSPLYLQAKNYFITKTGLYDNVNLMLLTRESDTPEDQITEEEEKEEELHHALFSSSMDDEAAIFEFIKTKEGKNIPLERIREVCGIPHTGGLNKYEEKEQHTIE